MLWNYQEEFFACKNPYHIMIRITSVTFTHNNPFKEWMRNNKLTIGGAAIQLGCSYDKVKAASIGLATELPLNDKLAHLQEPYLRWKSYTRNKVKLLSPVEISYPGGENPFAHYILLHSTTRYEFARLILVKQSLIDAVYHGRSVRLGKHIKFAFHECGLSNIEITYLAALTDEYWFYRKKIGKSNT